MKGFESQKAGLGISIYIQCNWVLYTYVKSMIVLGFRTLGTNVLELQFVLC